MNELKSSKFKGKESLKCDNSTYLDKLYINEKMSTYVCRLLYCCALRYVEFLIGQFVMSYRK